jgi:ribosomal protein L7/L12
VREAVERGETITAIKRLREATGMGLKEAKDHVDEVRRRTAAG